MIAHSSLKLLHGLVVQRRSARNGELHLAASGAHELCEFLGNALQHAQTVVLGKGVKEAGDGVGLILDGDGLLELGYDLLLVLDRQSWRGDKSLQLWVLLESRVQVFEGFGDVVDRGVLGRRGVLEIGLSAIAKPRKLACRSYQSAITQLAMIALSLAIWSSYLAYVPSTP